MEYILHLFSINTTMFTLWDYQMSYIEFFGTLFSITCVWLTAKAKIINWPIGIIGTILYLILFYQIHLYSDMLEQLYFLITGFIGWYAWLHPKSGNSSTPDKQLQIAFNSTKQNVVYISVILLGTLLLTYFVSNLDNWLPKYFPVQASFAFIDALTTVMSFMAQYLLIRKKVENWILWIIVDVVGIWLYWQKGVRFISMEYVLFLFIASYGLWGWIKELKINHHEHEQLKVQKI